MAAATPSSAGSLMIVQKKKPMDPPAAVVWQKATSRVIENNISKKNLEAFLKITRKSINSISTSYRADLDRVQDALKCGDIKTIDNLRLKGRANLNLPVDQITGFYPIHIVVFSLRNLNNREALLTCLQWLLDEMKVDIESRDSNGRNVLHIAANACDDPEVILLLLARGADPLFLSPVGDLPSAFAKLQRHKKVEKVLNEAALAVDTIKWAHKHEKMEKDYIPKLFPVQFGIDFSEYDEDRFDTNASLLSASNSRTSTSHGTRSHTSNSRASMGVTSTGGFASTTPVQLPVLDSPPKQAPVCLAMKLALSMKEKSLAREWKPSPHLAVVERANAAAARVESLQSRETKSQMFIDTLRARTLN
mmetsp:Transcript_45160/g.57839  ORF Transcript_45160/g.57839 Transcript_45160/m.57839 type:complete len:363 (-) Transcript_45160:121-1209(-)|eukprot:CAMPEP_0114347086 /NCGR_PEP_ID=MMETSP0101-20121206/13600_1 /TAXON_ID=38822 ORGANISM="Pteridomonas danica, Strain PT" /NCGR_SAMPLE_ID=MMETSP0101 /ASSEMBLY_ACC=CAM_ASM_000211 /LENGTH=362 /DNA_ID=CAMNT_0001484147 /DNA_START=36 /DNA_END=1124 /DNA_ORIENTATION=-